MAGVSAQAQSHLRWDEYFDRSQAEIYVSRWNWEGEYPRHDHDFLEIVLCVGGENRHTSIRGEEPLGVGDAYVMRPGIWHVMTGRKLDAYNCCFGLKLLWRELAWTIDDALLNPLLWSGPLSPGNDGILRLHLEASQRQECQRRLDAMLEMGNAGDPRLHAKRVGMLTLLLAELASALPAKPRATGGTHPAVMQTMRQLQAQLGRDWTMEELCQIAGLEQSYLIRLYRQATGLPPMAYLARLRAEKAASLLVSTAKPISAIGVSVGWEDPNYFARRFRQHFGVSASEYRERFGK